LHAWDVCRVILLRSIAIGLRLLILLTAALPVLPAGEYAVLTTGVRLRAERHVIDGENTFLYDREGGYSRIPTILVERFESDEGVPAAGEPHPLAQPQPATTADPMGALIDQAASRHGVDPVLVRSVIRWESAYHPQAVSSKGALGLMQLMPGTARELGVSRPFDPAQNIDGGTAYLRQLLDRYAGSGNWLERALAAYNAGPAVVDRHGGLPPYRETVDFVSRVSRAMLGPESRQPRPRP